MSDNQKYFIGKIQSMTKNGKVKIHPTSIDVIIVDAFGHFQPIDIVATGIDDHVVYGVDNDGQTDVALSKLPTQMLARLLMALI